LVTSVEYFAITAAVVAITEMWCGARIYFLQQKYQAKAKDGSDPVVIQEDFSTPSEVITRWLHQAVACLRFGTDVVTEECIPLQHFHATTQAATTTADTAPNATTATVSTTDNEKNAIVKPDEGVNGDGGNGVLSYALHLLWRFSPDLIAIGIGLSLSCFGTLCTSDTKTLNNYLEMMIIPFAFIIFLSITIHQRGSARYNLTRIFLESELLNFIGYGSYPIYLLQNVFLQYYFTFIFPVKGYSYHPENPTRDYFRAIPLGYRVIAVSTVILLGWVIQKFFQDYLVANTFSRVLVWWSSRQSSQQQHLRRWKK